MNPITNVLINNDLCSRDVAIRQFSVKSFRDQLGVKKVQLYFIFSTNTLFLLLRGVHIIFLQPVFRDFVNQIKHYTMQQ